MGARSSKDAPKARLNGMIWMVLALYGVIFTGFAGTAYFADNPLQNPETGFITLFQPGPVTSAAPVKQGKSYCYRL